MDKSAQIQMQSYCKQHPPSNSLLISFITLPTVLRIHRVDPDPAFCFDADPDSNQNYSKTLRAEIKFGHKCWKMTNMTVYLNTVHSLHYKFYSLLCSHYKILYVFRGISTVYFHHSFMGIRIQILDVDADPYSQNDADPDFRFRIPFLSFSVLEKYIFFYL